MNIKRLKMLAGLQEGYHASNEDIIRHIMEKIGFDIDDTTFSIMYDDAYHEYQVKLTDDEIQAEQLKQLLSEPLVDSPRIYSVNNHIELRFKLGTLE